MTDADMLARDILLTLIGKSGVKEWLNDDTRLQLAGASVDLADLILHWDDSMAVTAVYRKQFGTAKTFKKTGGTGAMTPSTLANGSYWQSAKIDLGATLASRYFLDLAVDLASTPTAGQTLDFWWNPSDSGTAATDNKGGASGSDATYAGYSSNAADSVAQLVPLGSFFCTVQTSTQKGQITGTLEAPNRYGSLVMLNNSGAAFASDTNFCVTITPEEITSEPS